jgi:gliding motility-associated-like protein
VAWTGGGAAGFGSGILDGGAGGAAGGSGTSGGGGGGGGGSGLYNGATPLLVAGGGGGGSGGGQFSSGATGGGGGVDGNPAGASCTTPGLTGASPNAFGVVGANKGGQDGGGGGGGGGGYNGGTGGGVASGCDCGACGGGGGGNFSAGFNTTILNGNGQTPGNNTDPDLPTGAAVGGGTSTAGGNGFIEIYYNPLPVPTAIFSANTTCFNTTPTQFTNSSTGAISQNWDFGDPTSTSNTSTAPNPTHTYTAPGSYTATLTVANTPGCTNTTTQTVTVNPAPVVNFSSTTVCFNNPTAFTDNSTGGATQWAWNFGDGNTSTVQSPSHTYNASGTYNVSFIVTNNFGCIDSIKANALINPLPVANFSAPTVCIGNQTCFHDSSTISSGSITGWGWNFADAASGPNNISTLQNPCHVFTNAATYSVLLTVTSNNGCQNLTNLNVLVNPIPTASFTATNVCQNIPTVFTNNSSAFATQWNWSFGDGNVSTLKNPTHTYPSYGNYISALIVSSGGCVDTTAVTLTVYPLPVVNFSSVAICKGDTTIFSDPSFIPSGNITTWNWNFGDGNSSTLQNPTHLYASDGTYPVTLTLTSNQGCTNSLQQAAIVRPLPQPSFSTSPGSIISITDNVIFNDLSTGGVQWVWHFGDTVTSTLQNPIHIYADTGTYIVTQIVTSQYGCVDSIKHVIETKDYMFYIPNSFTPNGDGINDSFYGKGLGITEYEMWIFDRWGNILFNCKVNGPPQSLPCMWNGTVAGGTNIIVHEDVYVWKVHFLNVFGTTHDYIGTVTVVK